MGRYKNDEKQTTEEMASDPPKLINELTKIASGFFAKNYKHIDKLSQRIPREPINVAKWWATIERQPINGYEDCEKRVGRLSQKEYWYCPYIDYCKRTLTNFLNQPADFQDFIIDANLEKCYWRGDEEKDFRVIYEKFNEGKNSIINKNETLRLLKQLYGGK